MPSPVLNEFNYQPISVLQNNLTTIHGIFSLLHELNGDFGTRYNIEANPREEFSAESLDRYFEWTDNKKYWAVDGSKNITINFNEPFLLSGYAISNGVQDSTGNTFPTAWKLYGFDNETNKRILLNKQTNQEFCGKRNKACKTESVKGFYISFQYRAFKSFIFEQTTNSGGNDYIFMRSIDLFGTLCGINGQCNFHFYQLTSKVKIKQGEIVLVSIFILNLH